MCCVGKGVYTRGKINVESLVLADMRFEMSLVVPSPQDQHMEDDILRVQELIKWADHLIFVFPTWWGNMSAAFHQVILIIAVLFVIVIFYTVPPLNLKESSHLNEVYRNIIYLAVIHAAWLLSMLYKFIRTEKKPNRIDGIMAVSLSYIMWFALVPFIKLT